MKLCLVAHCNFRGNSAMHVFSLATELTKMGHECSVLVPDSPETVHEHGEPIFEVMDYDRARTSGVIFGDGRGPDIVHAWTPRGHVRKITSEIVDKSGSRYVVHMEDNEAQIIQDESPGLDYSELLLLPADLVEKFIRPDRSHPRPTLRFMERAAGYSCLIDMLLEFKPKHVPGIVFWPGFDAPFERISDEHRGARPKYGLADNDIVVLYSGNVHPSIAHDVQKLYVCVGLLRRYGFPIKLVRTGWNFASIELDETFGLSDYVIDLGFVPRDDVPVLVGMSDILVQPGRSDAFNDYRFPSKLPEYLVSGRPVILPDSNIGRVLEGGKHVLKLHSGSLDEMLTAIRSLIESRPLSQELARNARSFALENLTWTRAAETLEEFYQRIMEAPSRSRETVFSNAIGGKEEPLPRTCDGIEVEEGSEEPTVSFPAKLIAFCHPQFLPLRENDIGLSKEAGLSKMPVLDAMHAHASLARRHGIYGFCFYYSWLSSLDVLEQPLDIWLSTDGPDFPFCICWTNKSRRWMSDRSENEDPVGHVYPGRREERFLEGLLPILRDPRYIRVDDAPLLLVHRITDLQDPVGTTQMWRRIARENGIERLHLCVVESSGIGNPRPCGFDALVESSPLDADRKHANARHIQGLAADGENLEDYIAAAMRSMSQVPVDYVRYRCVSPPDGTSDRRGKGKHVFIHDSPKAYGHWLRHLVREAMCRRRQQEPFVFINAWNEEAGGTCLEPSERYGLGLLEVTYDALCEGIIDHVHGPTARREREFTERVARLPVA